MTPEQWKLLSEAIDRQRLKDIHSRETDDLLHALAEIARNMWANTPKQS